MASFGSLGRRLLQVSRTGTVAVMPRFVERPAVSEVVSLHFLLVALRRLPFCAVDGCDVVSLPSRLTLVCHADVDVAWLALDAEVLGRLRQLSLEVGVVAGDVLPSVALVTGDCIPVIVSKATEAAYLPVVLLLQIQDGRVFRAAVEGMGVGMGMGIGQRGRAETEAVDDRGSEVGVSHAIAPEKVVVLVMLMVVVVEVEGMWQGFK